MLRRLEMDYGEDAMNTIMIFWILGIVLAIAFWGTVIYCCIRACKSVAERPRIVQVYQNEQQAQVHYVVHQEALGPDGRPIVYHHQQQGMPGQQYAPQYQQPVYYQQHPNMAVATDKSTASGANAAGHVV